MSYGYGLVFGAATSDRVDCGNDSSISDLTTGTVLVMEYPTTLTNSRVLISKYRGATTEGWQLNNKASGDGGLLQNELTRATTPAAFVASSLNRSVNNWYCSAMTWDHAASPVSHFYTGLHNVAMAETTYSTQQDGAGAFGLDAARSLFIGNRDTATPNQAYRGTIAVAAVYNRVLSLAECEEWRLRPSGSIGSGGVVFIVLGRYGATGTQSDLTGTGNDGTITGCTASGVQLPLSWRNQLVGAGAGRSLIGGGL